jgi:hypothetical protein
MRSVGRFLQTVSPSRDDLVYRSYLKSSAFCDSPMSNTLATVLMLPLAVPIEIWQLQYFSPYAKLLFPWNLHQIECSQMVLPILQEVVDNDSGEVEIASPYPPTSWQNEVRKTTT